LRLQPENALKEQEGRKVRGKQLGSYISGEEAGRWNSFQSPSFTVKAKTICLYFTPPVATFTVHPSTTSWKKRKKRKSKLHTDTFLSDLSSPFHFTLDFAWTSAYPTELSFLYILPSTCLLPTDIRPQLFSSYLPSLLLFQCVLWLQSQFFLMLIAMIAICLP